MFFLSTKHALRQMQICKPAAICARRRAQTRREALEDWRRPYVRSFVLSQPIENCQHLFNLSRRMDGEVRGQALGSVLILIMPGFERWRHLLGVLAFTCKDHEPSALVTVFSPILVAIRVASARVRHKQAGHPKRRHSAVCAALVRSEQRPAVVPAEGTPWFQSVGQVHSESNFIHGRKFAGFRSSPVFFGPTDEWHMVHTSLNHLMVA